MISVPRPEHYNVSPQNGFLPTEPPLQALPDAYYEPWEYIIGNLQGLYLSRRLRSTVDKLPVLSTENLHTEPEWRRAYCALAFISHAYIWGDKRPSERVPPPISIPFLKICKHLELPPVATFAAVCLWNWRPISADEPANTLQNLDTLSTFTGAIDEKWFYLVSIAIEAQGGPLVPLLLNATAAAANNDRETVVSALTVFAERLDEIGNTLTRMYDDCDPHIFYHRIRPFLAGSKNMADAGLPNGVIFDDGGPMHKQRYVQFSGGSNAQSSLIQFFDLILSIEHRPTGEKKVKEEDPSSPTITTNLSRTENAALQKKRKAAASSGFHHEMRKYMPGQHARFLARVAEAANLRAYVQSRPRDSELGIAFDACVAMLTALRDKHIQMVSRYIIIKSREKPPSHSQNGEEGANGAPLGMRKSRTEMNLASAAKSQKKKKVGKKGGGDGGGDAGLKGTGGSSLIPFLRQARDETAEPAVAAWAQRVLSQRGRLARMPVGGVEEVKKQGSDEMWRIENGTGGLCIQ